MTAASQTSPASAPERLSRSRRLVVEALGCGLLVVALEGAHHGAEHLSVWLPAGLGAQEALIESDPKRYFRPPYVGASGWVGVVLDTKPDWKVVSWLVEQGYRLVAHPRLVAQLPPREAP